MWHEVLNNYCILILKTYSKVQGHEEVPCGSRSTMLMRQVIGKSVVVENCPITAGYDTLFIGNIALDNVDNFEVSTVSFIQSQ